MKVLSVTEALALAASRSVTPLEEFPGKGFFPWRLRCLLCSSEISSSFNKLKMAKEIGCPDCSRSIQAKLKGHRLTKSKLAKNDWELLTLLSEYQDSLSLADVRCTLCGKTETYYPHLLIHKMCACKIEAEANAKLESGRAFAKARGGSLLSSEYSGSKEPHTWQCAEGHVWEAAYASIAREGGTWCPYCSGRVAIQGINDLGTVDPLLASEFNVELNDTLKVSSLKPNSNVKVWWLCSRKHAFEATVSNRYHLGTGCPFCSGRYALPGFNDLLTLDPEIAAYWHPTKNGELHPSGVTRTANRKIWWLCEFGHETFNDLRTKVATRGSCSSCTGKVLNSGVNDIATKRPDLAAQWHPTKNGDLTPSDFTPNSNKKVWWLCGEGHIWAKDCNGRAQGRGCPYCAFKKCWPGFNDLETTHPYLVEEWDWQSNTLNPNQIIAGGHHDVSWICPVGHGSYKALTLNRAFGAEQGCPKCSDGGYKPVYRGMLYFIENESLHARKIGITNSHKNTRRLQAFEKNGWRRVKIWEHENGMVAKAMETSLLKGWIRREFQLKQFLEKNEMAGLNGHTETFSIEGPSNVEIVGKADLLFKLLSEAVEADARLVEELS